MARLRLQAGCCMLKLAQEPVYADAIKLEQFQTMALLASVSCRYYAKSCCYVFWHTSYNYDYSCLFSPHILRVKCSLCHLWNEIVWSYIFLQT